MHIPTAIVPSKISLVVTGLNAPQGFMLIPTVIDEWIEQGVKSLNAPQGFMLIPTSCTRASNHNDNCQS